MKSEEGYPVHCDVVPRRADAPRFAAFFRILPTSEFAATFISASRTKDYGGSGNRFSGDDGQVRIIDL